MKSRHPEKVNNAINPIKKKPDWIRSRIIDSKIFFETKQVINQNTLVNMGMNNLKSIRQDLYNASWPSTPPSRAVTTI